MRGTTGPPAALLVLLALGSLLVGCGEDDDGAAASGEETTSQPAGGTDPTTTGGSQGAASTGAGPAPTVPSIQAVGSGGCGTRPDDVPASRVLAESMDSGGHTRDYLVYVPDAYTGDEPVALVFTLHGAGSNKEQQLAYSAFGPLADEDGTIVVAPDATGDPRRWSPYGAEPSVSLGGINGVNDLDFFAELVDEVEAAFCIDPARIYATGMSSGGFMSAAIACEYSDRIAAVAPVTATVYTEGACGEAATTPYVYFHGTDDPVVPFLGPVPGPGGEPGPGAAEVSSQAWAEHNGCDPDPTDERIGTEVIHRSWSGCDAPTDLYIVEGGGHTWPGGLVDLPPLGHTTRDIVASEIIWELFAQSRLDG
jgi:polyhydroxybutyrate depolymerase